MSRARILVAVLAGGVPLIPIVIGVAMNSGSTPARTGAVTTSTSVSAPSRSPAGPAGGGGRTHPRLLGPPGRGAIVARLRHTARLLHSPNGRPYGPLGLRTPFGSPQTLLVVRMAGRWLGVLSPVAGNHRVGWIRVSAASLTRVRWTLSLSLRHRRLTVSDGGHVMRRFVVAIGAPASPTPTGRYAVTDRLHTGDPAGPYGCCILALTAVAPHAIQGWTGGNRIAIHSTPDTASIGQAVSHGCVRLTLAQGRWLLSHIPLGTPTVISSA